MRIVIFHYHLNPGGVTRIVESQVEALKEIDPKQQILIVTGGCEDRTPFARLGIELIVNEELNYLTNRGIQVE